jgi:hypothetical protein
MSDERYAAIWATVAVAGFVSWCSLPLWAPLWVFASTIVLLVIGVFWWMSFVIILVDRHCKRPLASEPWRPRDD